MARLALFDAHCHLQDSRIAHCAPQLIQKASEVGVQWFAVNGTSEEDWAMVRKMGETYQSVIPNFGLHPWWIPKRSQNWLSSLREILEAVPTAGIGEVGLDSSKRGKETSLSLQMDILREQLSLAQELRRPVSVHCVHAIGALRSVLSEMGTFSSGLIMHSFNGPAEIVQDLVDVGAYFSFSGFFCSVSPDKSKAKRVLNQVPLDRILLETDAPDALPKVVDSKSLFLVPEAGDIPSLSDEGGDPDKPFCCLDGSPTETVEEKEPNAKKTLNHPANIQTVSSYVANVLGVSEEELTARSVENAKRIFSFPGSKLLL